MVVRAVKSLFQDTAIALDPFTGFLERTGLEPAWPPLRFPPPRDQACPYEHLEVPGHGRQAYLEGLGELLDRDLAFREACKDCPSCGICQCPEYGIEIN